MNCSQFSRRPHIVCGQELLPWEVRLRQCDLFRLEKWFREELSHLPVPTRRSITSVVHGGIMRDKGYELKQEKVHLNRKKNLRTVRHWNEFSRGAVLFL